jgi:hypothetical protein
MSESNFPLRPIVISIVTTIFTPEERETVTEMLMEECNAQRLNITSEDAVERIQLAVLKLSNGDAEKFLAAAELAQLDWRDALVAAGFGNDLEAHLNWAEEILG